jgi:hypothetical protein
MNSVPSVKNLVGIGFSFRMFHPPCVRAGHGVSAGMIGRYGLAQKHPQGDDGVVNSIAATMSKIVTDLIDFGGSKEPFEEQGLLGFGV